VSFNTVGSNAPTQSKPKNTTPSASEPVLKTYNQRFVAHKLVKGWDRHQIADTLAIEPRADSPIKAPWTPKFLGVGHLT
jgi:hypothetical protein